MRPVLVPMRVPMLVPVLVLVLPKNRATTKPNHGDSSGIWCNNGGGASDVHKSEYMLIDKNTFFPMSATSGLLTSGLGSLSRLVLPDRNWVLPS